MTEIPNSKRVLDKSMACLDFHAHEDPIGASDVEITSPVVEGGHFEAHPLKTLGQLDGVLRRYAPVDASYDVVAIQRTIRQLDECHQTFFSC